MPTPPGADLIEVPHAPHAPHAPSAEEILGPPPKPPRIGSKGGAGRLRFKRGGYHPGRPPSPTRAAEHAREQQQARTAKAQAGAPQKVTVDVKTARPETPRPAGARGPQYNARLGIQRRRVINAQDAENLRKKTAAERKADAHAAGEKARTAGAHNQPLPKADPNAPKATAEDMVKAAAAAKAKRKADSAAEAEAEAENQQQSERFKNDPYMSAMYEHAREADERKQRERGGDAS